MFEKGTRTPLAGIRIYLLPYQLKAVSNNQGEFVFEQAPLGDCEWIIHEAGFLPFKKTDSILSGEKSATPDNEVKRIFFIEKNSYGAFETTVYGKLDRQDDSVKSLTSDQFENLPGSGGDPIRAIENLPGMARSSNRSNAIIEGSSPKDTRYTVDGHEIPLSFHLLGNTSVIMPDAVDRVDYFAAGFGPTYGRALGGIIGLWTKAPRMDRLHGTASLDFYNAGFLLDGPVGKKSSLLIGMRKSYVDLLLNLLLNNRDDFSYRISPNFSDLTSIYDTEVTPIDHFKLLTLGSIDSIELFNKGLSNKLNEQNFEFYRKISFIRLIPQWVHQHSALTTSRWSFGIGKDWTRLANSGEKSYETGNFMTARGELERKMSPSWTSVWGNDYRYLSTHTERSSTRLNIDRLGIETSSHAEGFYWLNTLHEPDSKWTWMPGMRFDYFSATHAFLPAPRFASRYQVSQDLFLRGATGLYYQPPENVEISSTRGNPDLATPRAWHLALGMERDFREGSSQGFTYSLGGFYRSFERLVSYSNKPVLRDGLFVPQVYSNEGKGRSLGVENLLKFQSAWYEGWLAYTLSRSTRTNLSDGEYLFDHDQTHDVNWINNFIFPKNWPKNWKIATRFRFVSGNPVTPVLGGEFDVDSGYYDEIFGPINSGRLGNFMQIDFRIDKKWIYETWILTAYLDIQNITNRENEEFLLYSYDKARSAVIGGLPILPTLGVKAEF